MNSQISSNQRTNSWNGNTIYIVMSFVPPLLYFCPWHTCCSQSDWYSRSMPQVQSCCVAQPHLLCECWLGELLWTLLTLYHCGMRKLPETLEKDLQDRKLISFSALVSASQQLPVWSGSLSSGGEPDLQPYSPGSGWFGVLSEIAGLIFLGSWLMFLVWSLTMCCWEIINALLSEPQVELMVSLNAQKRQIFQVLSWLLWIRCCIVLGVLDTS